LPGEQLRGAEMPAGQYEPTGHTFPETPSTGVGTVAFETQ
jgi:hypothetical protein